VTTECDRESLVKDETLFLKAVDFGKSVRVRLVHSVECSECMLHRVSWDSTWCPL